MDVPLESAGSAARDRRDVRALSLSVAFVWLATALLFAHPHYREVGASYLDRLGLPHWLMAATCAAELALGVVVAVARPTWLWFAAQAAPVAVFTLILATLEPLLLAHPYGVLSKNLPLVGALATATLAAREGFSARVLWLLRISMALPWLTEGLVPKLLFVQQAELEVVRQSGLVPMDAKAFLHLLGLAQIASAVAALVLRGRPLLLLLCAQVAALLALPILVAQHDPLLWVHPFLPLLKNVPILVGTVVVVRRCSTSS
ncbi:MAG: hypothetical protein A2138_03555 [Deltaproteobacteria bacterium RBG_16_71_12]|nr:MAG: hypothetical protein A2138_03555 [Deltaproteobacteria bacterium RBG_16_71_12]